MLDLCGIVSKHNRACSERGLRAAARSGGRWAANERKRDVGREISLSLPGQWAASMRGGLAA